MKRPQALVLAFIALLLSYFAATASADLAADIRAVLNHKVLSKGELGIEIIQLGDSPKATTTIYQYKAAVPRIPASNLKVVTTAAALEKLGGDFQFRTTLAGNGTDLVLIGDGDPTLGDTELLRKVGWGVDTVFKTWAEMLKQRGIAEVRDVCVDDSIFDEVFVHPNWPQEQEHKRYVAQVGGVNLNANCIDFFLRTNGFGQTVDYRIEPQTGYATIGNTCAMGGRNAVWLSRQLGTNDIVLRGETDAANVEPISVTIHDPPMFAATVLAETLKSSGIRVTGSVKRDRTIRASLAAGASGPATWVPLAVHSTPLTTVISRANKDSVNLYAESLCKRVGAQVSGQSGSWENGNGAIGGFLESIGVSKEEFTLDDGCGLSKKNAISPNAIARVLEHKFHDADRETFLNSLAVAGVDGTFEDRFRETDLRRRVFGKSGYVRGVASLSGYLKSKNGGAWYAFSILMNETYDYATAKVLQERIVKAIDAASIGHVAAGQ